MSFKKLLHARGHFQAYQHKMTVLELQELLINVEKIERAQVSLVNKIKATDLAIDIEHQMDLLNNPELLKHLRKQQHLVMGSLPKQNRIVPELPPLEAPPIDESQPLDVYIDNLNNHEDLLRKFEKLICEKVLYMANGNKTKAAEVLGVTVKTIYNKIEAHNIHSKRVSKNSLEYRH